VISQSTVAVIPPIRACRHDSRPTGMTRCAALPLALREILVAAPSDLPPGHAGGDGCRGGTP